MGVLVAVATAGAVVVAGPCAGKEGVLFSKGGGLIWGKVDVFTIAYGAFGPKGGGGGWRNPSFSDPDPPSGYGPE